MDRFKELGIDTHGRTSGKMKTKCPWCHAQRTDKRDKSLSVNLDTKLYLCHYCGAHGSAAIYAGKGRKLGDPLVKFPTATGSNSSCPPSEKPHGDPEQGALTQKQIEWCRDVRHIPPEVLVEAGVAFASISMPISGKEKGWEKRDCLCFNFFENGELVNTKFRDSQKHFKLLQGARTIPYNIDAIRDTPECILVEGEFDALSYMAVGRTDVISVPNGANSQLDWLDELSESHFEQKQVIYLSVDTDRKGRELCRELSRRLGVDRCRIVTYGEAYKDANELLVAEGPDALLKALEDAPIPRLEGTFTAEDLREGLHQLFEEGYTSGVELGIPNLDEIMRLETGRVLTVTGIEGSWFAVSYNGVSGYVASQYVLICSPSTADTSAPETPEETPAETPDETPTDNPAATVSGSEIVSLAQQYLGVPYVYGGSSPSGFDCSGFTMYIFAQVGVKLPHGATSQLSYGASVSRSELQPGDLVFFQDYGAVASHVGIYIGGDQFIHASSSSGNSRCVTVSSLAESYYANHYYTARRH